MKQINLIPPDYAHSRYVRRRAAIWAELVLAVSAMVAALGLNLHRQLQAAQRETSRLIARQQMHKQVCADIRELTRRKTEAIGQLEETYALQRKRIYCAILSDIAAACNERVFLVEVEADETAEKPGSASPLPVRSRSQWKQKTPPGKAILITLKGHALTNLDLTQFVSGLSMSEVLKDVSLKFWRQGAPGKSKLISFEIECRPAGEAQD